MKLILVNDEGFET